MNNINNTNDEDDEQQTQNQNQVNRIDASRSPIQNDDSIVDTSTTLASSELSQYEDDVIMKLNSITSDDAAKPGAYTMNNNININTQSVVDQNLSTFETDVMNKVHLSSAGSSPTTTDSDGIRPIYLNSDTCSLSDNHESDDDVVIFKEIQQTHETLGDYELSVRAKHQEYDGHTIQVEAAGGAIPKSTVMELIDEIIQSYEDDDIEKQTNKEGITGDIDDMNQENMKDSPSETNIPEALRNFETRIDTNIQGTNVDVLVGAYAVASSPYRGPPVLPITPPTPVQPHHHQQQNVENLVEAIEVNDDSTNNGRQPVSAVMYNPDDDDGKKKSYFSIDDFNSLGIVLLKIDESSSDVPQYRTTLGIRENIERIIDPELLHDMSNPYRKALDWITYTDPVALTPTSPRFFQRYILAYIYFATWNTGSWKSDCAPIFEGEYKDDCIYVYPYDKFTNFTSRLPRLRWFSNTDECKWAGIDCDQSNQIVDISLSDLGLSGTFPEGIFHLQYLNRLSLIYGAIPDIWYDHPTLIHLNVGNNQVGGPLTKNITKARDMRHLAVANNLHTGIIPSEIGEMLNLNEITLKRNDFNGTIPSSIGNLKYLQVLDLSGNAFTGSIPNSIGDIIRLSDVFLYENLLTGTLPRSIWDCTKLAHVRIGSNQFNGTIDVSMNQFSGTIPSRLPKVYLKAFRASGNQFNGTVDPQVCSMVDKFGLKDLELDCARPKGGNVAAEISCSCCSLCCNPDGEDCLKF